MRTATPPRTQRGAIGHDTAPHDDAHDDAHDDGTSR
jgi:hypothetical protein